MEISEIDNKAQEGQENITPLPAQILQKNHQESQQMQQQPHQTISDASVIILIWRIIQQMRKRGDSLTLDCILNQEKLLHLTLMALEKKTLKAAPFDLTEEVASFVQKINKFTMQSFNGNGKQDNINSNLFIKAIDLLMVKSLGKYLKPLRILGELKVLTFNNLACIYKKKKKYNLALRAVTFALQIEEILIKDTNSLFSPDKQQKHNIITTYLNKAAILSQMGKHEKAVQEINKGIKILKVIQKETLDKLRPPTNINLLGQQQQSSTILSQQQRKILQERKYYTFYMKMIVYYNLGAQKQHLNMSQSALGYYRKGKQLAKVIGNDWMEKKFSSIISKLTGGIQDEGEEQQGMQNFRKKQNTTLNGQSSFSNILHHKKQYEGYFEQKLPLQKKKIFLGNRENVTSS